MEFRIRTISIVPKSRHCRKTGTDRKAVIDVFVENLGLTLRGLRLNYDPALGWVVFPPEAKLGESTPLFPVDSALAKDIARIASKDYLSLSEDELEFRIMYFSKGTLEPSAYIPKHKRVLDQAT